MFRNFSKAKGAFTLIELLISITIISLLAAILFPAFSRVRENAHRTSCASNMRQLGMALTQYAQDYDEILPSARINGVPRDTDVDTSWRYVIQPYVKNGQILTCPSRNNPAYITGIPDGPKMTASYAGNFIRGNAVGGYLADYGTFTGGGRGNGLAAFQYASSTIAVVENDKTHQHFIDITDRDTGTCSEWSTNGECFYSGHLNTSNYLFVDGHVKAMRPTQTIQNNVNMWSRTNEPASNDIPYGGANSAINMRLNLEWAEYNYFTR